MPLDTASGPARDPMMDFFHDHLWAAVLLGIVALLLVVVWGRLDQRRELAQRTGTWRRPKPAPPREPRDR